ncbi:40S ribosomal protein S23 [Lemmus lemmus]
MNLQLLHSSHCQEALQSLAGPEVARQTIQANLFGHSSENQILACKGNCARKKIGVEAKQPDSAIRKCVRVQLIKNSKKMTALVPNDGCLNFTEENYEDEIAGFG